MIVSHKWLQDYVKLEMSVDDLTDRLTMTGLNLEGVEQVGDDIAIDLEVTSNRADCLGHIGVAREISVIFDTPLSVKEPAPATSATPASAATSVDIECPQLCPQYSARVIKGIKIGPSPQWLQDRLTTLGIAVINNVVDITNYVMMECGQPLHAFDFDKLHGNRIVVRNAKPGEKITAIDQREYELNADDCVIADADRPVAIAGVMGGFDTEISNGTVNVLIEAASFAPLSVRTTARRLSLHSPSSFRFERTVDRQQLDWASKRCCELILELAGGELLEGEVLAGEVPPNQRPAVSMRLSQITRLLGIDVPPDDTRRILLSLGLKQHEAADADSVAFEPPSWRRDLTRECDLIEEVARLYGYERIPTDANIPTASTSRTTYARVVNRVCETLNALGFYEAITLSFVSEEQNSVFTPRSTKALAVEHSSRKLENVLRQSLIPSLLQSRRENERHGTPNAELYEISRVYLAAGSTVNDRESEPRMVSLVSGRPFAELKGVLTALVQRICPAAELTVATAEVPQFTAGRGAELSLNGQLWGWVGEIDRSVSDKYSLRDAVTVAEVNIDVLETLADLVPQYAAVAAFPPVPRDLNFVLDESVTWQDLEATVRKAAGPLLDEISFASQYRGSQIEAGKKSYVVTIQYRSPERTLTAEEIETIQKNVIAECEQELSASLR